MTPLAAQLDTLARLRTREVVGAVAAVRGLSLFVDDLPLPVGTMVRLDGETSRRRNVEASRAQRSAGGAPAHAARRGEVVGFTGTQSIVMLYGSTEGIAPGAAVVGEQSAHAIQAGMSMLGRVLDGFGRPIDDRGHLSDCRAQPLHPVPLAALRRRRIDEPLPTGVRAIDAMLTLGRGQRIGVFSGPGVGKSTLLSMIARHTAADVSVIALIGERGKEVRDFIETALGPEGLARSVVIVSTGDESPLMRVRAAATACAVAEHFRDQGKHVLLQMDSITRLAQAQRQIGLAIGEPPATKGYTPSVEGRHTVMGARAAALEQGGSITGIYSVLVEGDDLTEPISDATRGILDGHIALSRRLAARGHYPAIDILESISRAADDVCDANHIAARRRLRRLIAAYAEAEELINIGAYARGSNPDCDTAIALKPAIDQFLTQDRQHPVEYPQICRSLIDLALQAEAIARQRDKGSESQREKGARGAPVGAARAA